MAELTTSEYHQLEQEYPSAPPPEYGSALAEDGRPPPYNPRSNSLRNACKLYLICINKCTALFCSASNGRILSQPGTATRSPKDGNSEAKK